MSNWTILKRLLAAPLMGAAFVVFLPCVGFWMLAKIGWQETSKSVRRAYGGVAASI